RPSGAPGGRDFPLELIGRFLIAAVDERHLGPFLRQGLHDCLADPPAAAGYQGYLILQRHHAIPVGTDTREETGDTRKNHPSRVCCLMSPVWVSTPRSA